MVKKLVLIRHAKSDWNVGVDDYNRPLNERGRKDAPNIGKHLKAINLLPDKIVSSSAERAINTARLIANGVGFPLSEIIETRELYHASHLSILKQVNHTKNDVNTLFIVGHNPGISDFLSYLVDEDYELKTCCVAEISLLVPDWSSLFKGTCVLKQYISPREI
jgi:phosphohistidine phosphatase